MHVITTTGELAAACTRLARCDHVTVDTEFIRESTFWPELCLIQMAGPEEALIVDPLAKDMDLAPFFALMADETVTKVFHAARQDIEIIHHLAGIIPHPIFDTQVAAMVCGFGEQVSYVNLVKKLLDVSLDKSSQYTDWRRRPLAAKQLAYALADVTHLRDIYARLKGELETSGRAGWLAEEMAVLTDPATYALHPENAWMRMRKRVKSRRALAVLMEVAEWRERRAQETDVPRGRVLRDEAIYDIANQAPRNAEELARLRTCSKGFARSNSGRQVLDAVARGLARDLSEVPSLEKAVRLSPEHIAVVDLLKVLLKAAAARHRVAAKLIATTDDLERIAVHGPRAETVPALKGWRRMLFGEDALRLRSGELALAVEGGAVRAIERPQEAERGTQEAAGEMGRQSAERARAP